MTRVTIIGAGNMGRGIAARMVAGGHELRILAPTPKHATELADELRPAAAAVTGGGMTEPVTGDVVVFATPYDASLELAENLGPRLTGMVVVDISNPVDFATFDNLVTPPDSSAAEEIARRLSGSAVVKAFNTTFAGTLVTGQVAGQPLDVLLAGDDAEAKGEVARLVESGGMRAVDAGPLRRARQLEHTGFLHMALQEPLGTGFGSALKFLGP